LLYSRLVAKGRIAAVPPANIDLRQVWTCPCIAPKVPLPAGESGPPPNRPTWFTGPWAPQVDTPNGISIDSAILAQLMVLMTTEHQYAASSAAHSDAA